MAINGLYGSSTVEAVIAAGFSRSAALLLATCYLGAGSKLYLGIKSIVLVSLIVVLIDWAFFCIYWLLTQTWQPFLMDVGAICWPTTLPLSCLQRTRIFSFNNEHPPAQSRQRTVNFKKIVLIVFLHGL